MASTFQFTLERCFIVFYIKITMMKCYFRQYIFHIFAHTTDSLPPSPHCWFLSTSFFFLTPILCNCIFYSFQLSPNINFYSPKERERESFHNDLLFYNFKFILFTEKLFAQILGVLCSYICIFLISSVFRVCLCFFIIFFFFFVKSTDAFYCFSVQKLWDMWAQALIKNTKSYFRWPVDKNLNIVKVYVPTSVVEWRNQSLWSL